MLILGFPALSISQLSRRRHVTMSNGNHLYPSNRTRDRGVIVKTLVDIMIGQAQSKGFPLCRCFHIWHQLASPSE